MTDYCVDCDQPATTTRPLTQPWLTTDGVITDGVERVCLRHTDPELDGTREDT